EQHRAVDGRARGRVRVRRVRVHRDRVVVRPARRLGHHHRNGAAGRGRRRRPPRLDPLQADGGTGHHDRRPWPLRWRPFHPL
ncbi:MAG: hypothetical protein AVDCRST_MAG19-3474, partial [uncultured Thermomicrobiales bacterium]